MKSGWRRSLPFAIVACTLAAATPAAVAAPLLPDIQQLLPTRLMIAPDDSPTPRYFLSFDSRIANGRGSNVGPLIIRARRSSTAAPMAANQAIRQTDGSERMRLGIGELAYEVNPTHHHWHYKGFDHYELRRASDLTKVRPDNKAGFCMPDSLFTPDYCGSGNPGALAVDEGMSRGYVDLYQANLEGQNIDVTGVPPGLYYLDHWVNRDSSLCESGFSNNVSAMLIKLWPAGYGKQPYHSLLEEIDWFSPPEVQPKPSNCAWKVDRVAPRLRLRIAARQRAQVSQGVAAKARCSELCTVTLSARLFIGRRSYKLSRSRSSLAARKREKVVGVLSKSQLRAVRRARRRHSLVTVKIALRAGDRLGNRSRIERRTVVVR